jgi:hypothetical protein
VSGSEGPEKRNAIVDKLAGKAWYMASDFELRVKLANLPADHDGYLEDLANRPDNLGSLTVHKIVGLKQGNFALITLFEVTQPGAEKPYTYEYVSWRQGPLSGAKGLVLIANGEGKITHFVILRGPKFAVGGIAFDIVGGFAEVNEAGVGKMIGRFEKELQEELGVPTLTIKQIHDLGNILPDAGMTNNHPKIFAAVIDASEAKKIGELPNPDPWELDGLGPIIMPIGQLAETILANNDAFFHIVVTRLVAKGVLPASALYSG